MVTCNLLHAASSLRASNLCCQRQISVPIVCRFLCQPYVIRLSLGESYWLTFCKFIFFFFFFSHTFTFQLLDKPWSQDLGVVPSPPRFLPSIFFAHRVQQSHCSSILHRVLLTHALALSASQFVHKKKSQRIYTSRMHSAGLELTKLTYLCQARG